MLPKTYHTSGFTHKDFASVLNQYNYCLNLGDITAGTIFSEEKAGFLVDIGTKIAAYLPKDEVTVYKKHINSKQIINETREFFILAYNKDSEQLVLSIKRLEYIRAWERIKQMKEEDTTLNIMINEINKGGLLTSIEGIQGFIPNSQIVNMHQKNLLLNQNIKCQFLLINEKSNKLILSHKRAILNALHDKMRIGDIATGVVSKVTTYGTFVNIHGINALLHISEINKTKDSNINPVLEIGKQIKVKIIHIDQKQGRLSVSQKNL